MRGFQYKKAVQALNYFALKEGGEINKMKAIKLIWLSDRLHLRTFGRMITNDTYFALKFGPVPSATRDLLGNSFSSLPEETEYVLEYLDIDKQYYYNSKKQPYLKVFSQTDRDILNNVYDYYGKYNQYTLRDISHRFPEWKRWEAALKQDSTSRFQMIMEDFFEEEKEPAPLFEAEDQALPIVKSIYFRTDNSEGNAK